MGKIIELKEGVISISPECLLIEPFKSMWEKDKSKDKVVAVNDIKYLWFFIDFASPYFMYDDERKHQMICEYVLGNKDYKKPVNLNHMIDSYNAANPRPAVDMLQSAMEVIYKMKDFFKSVDFTETQTNKMGVEEFTFDIDKISKAITNMPKLIDSLNQATELAKKEQSGSSKVRGNATTSMLEDNKL